MKLLSSFELLFIFWFEGAGLIGRGAGLEGGGGAGLDEGDETIGDESIVLLMLNRLNGGALWRRSGGARNHRQIGQLLAAAPAAWGAAAVAAAVAGAVGGAVGGGDCAAPDSQRR